MPRFNPLLDNLATYPAVRLEELKAEVIASGKKLYDFSVGDPKEPTPSFVREALVGAVSDRCPYPTVAGRQGVRDAISAYYKRRFGVDLDPATQIIPTAGSKEAVFHTPLLVIDPAASDKLVIAPDPGYPAYQRGALFAGGEFHAHILTGDYLFRPWELPEDMLRRCRMMWLNSPHNPSGAVSPLEHLERTVALAQEYDFLLINDETYADVYHTDPPHSLLQAGLDNVLVLHSLSKRSGMTGHRSGFLAGDPALIARLKRFRSNPGCVPQDFVNAAAEVAWADDAHVAERRAAFGAKRRLFLDFFEEIGVDVVASEATIYLWLKAPDGMDDQDYAAALLDQGIVVSPGRIYGVAGGGIGYVRLALVPDMDQCREAIDHWRAQCT